jgi:nitrogen-specific signal transduction histidine kinase
MTYEQQWLEYDYNPFILFSSSGKILSANSEAQFLLGSASTHELFELATSYANVTFGFKTTFIDLEFGRYKFFGLTVGYENEEEIGVKLYQTPSFKIKSPKPQGELTNIYTLIDLCISTNSINSNVKYQKDFDPTIPDIMLNSNSFIKLLNKIYIAYSENEVVRTKVYFRVGEHIRYEEKKYTLFSIEVNAIQRDETKIEKLKQFVQNSDFCVDFQNKITINIPIITS